MEQNNAAIEVAHFLLFGGFLSESFRTLHGTGTSAECQFEALKSHPALQMSSEETTLQFVIG